MTRRPEPVRDSGAGIAGNNRTKRLPTRALTALTAAVLASLLMAVAFAPAAEASERHGCPPQAVCIYPRNAGWNHNEPTMVMQPQYARFPGGHEWWNLSHQIGIHKVFNNTCPFQRQFARLNSGYNGGGSAIFDIAEGRSFDLDLTRVNSITLWWYDQPEREEDIEVQVPGC